MKKKTFFCVCFIYNIYESIRYKTSRRRLDVDPD